MQKTSGLTCEYCGAEQPPEALETRHEKLVCRDIGACDAREAAAHRHHLAELRRLQRIGEELTEAERQELAQ